MNWHLHQWRVPWKEKQTFVQTNVQKESIVHFQVRHTVVTCCMSLKRGVSQNVNEGFCDVNQSQAPHLWWVLCPATRGTFWRRPSTKRGWTEVICVRWATATSPQWDKHCGRHGNLVRQGPLEDSLDFNQRRRESQRHLPWNCLKLQLQRLSVEN